MGFRVKYNSLEASADYCMTLNIKNCNYVTIKECFEISIKVNMGRSPGLVVMGGDSRSKGHGFKSRHRIVDGHFSHIFVVKICNVCLKRPKINEKDAGVGQFFF